MSSYYKFRVKIWNKDGSLEVQYYHEMVEHPKDIGPAIKHIRSVIEDLRGDRFNEIEIENLGLDKDYRRSWLPI